MHARHLARLIPVAAIATLAACGSDSKSADMPTMPMTTEVATAVSAAGAAAGLSLAEVEFNQGMIAHHEQAIEMAEIALDPTRGARPEVVDLATRIKGAQDGEVAMMTGWLTAAGAPLQMDMSGGHDMMSMPGMMSAEQMDELSTLTGAEFDAAWLSMMIAHHEGAITQAKDVKAAGANADIAALADAIVAAQQGEITEMRALLGQ